MYFHLGRATISYFLILNLAAWEFLQGSLLLLSSIPAPIRISPSLPHRHAIRTGRHTDRHIYLILYTPT